jgi:hypothetical protein
LAVYQDRFLCAELDYHAPMRFQHGLLALGALASAACSSPFATGAPDSGPDGASDATGAPLFSFFYTSLAALRTLSGNANGFGGDLRYGGATTGLEGADRICQAIAAMQDTNGQGFGAKTWRAFLSVTSGPDGTQVNAVDRIGNGPWYDRKGRLFANDKAGLGLGSSSRPDGDPAVVNDLPDESGQGTMQLGTTFDAITGTNTDGNLQYPGQPRNTCNDWTDATLENVLVVCGHSWPSGPPPGSNWISAHPERSCIPGVEIVQPPAVPKADGSHIGAGGGYGGFYCFALTP